MRHLFVDSLRVLLEDYINARESFPDDILIENILEALLLSRRGLQNDPWQFIPQLLGRLKETKVQISVLVNVAFAVSEYLQ